MTIYTKRARLARTPTARMRWATALCGAWVALTAPSMAASASAYSFTPRSAHFVSAGRMRMSAGALGADCATIFEGVTDGEGGGKITSAAFSGGLLGACGGLRPVGLPWTITPVAPDRAVISAVGVKSSLIGDCGPGDVPITVAAGGVVEIGRVPLGRCSINAGRLASKPSLVVVGR